MHNVLENIDELELNKIDLDTEFKMAMKKSDFKAITKNLQLDDNELKKYTSLLEESSIEYGNCKNCKNLLECKNKVEGFCYLPINNNGNLTFTYKPCKYKEVSINKNKHLENIKFFNTPEYVKDANLESIYDTDKNRIKVINWLMDFLDDFESGKSCKGLYLHGNKSSIIFWPEFLRQAFYEDFNSKFEYVKKVPLLLIDDIGAEGLTDWNRDEILCPLLQYRMDNNLTTFFTSNLNLKELESHLATSKRGVDEVKSKRIISRIEQLTEDLEMISKNLRK